MANSSVLWRPTDTILQNSNLLQYREWLYKNGHGSFEDYESLRRWSNEHSSIFWESIWTYFEIMADGFPESIQTSEGMPSTRWFTGTRLNYAEHLFRKKSNQSPSLVFMGEDGQKESMSWNELELRVSVMQRYLRQLGVKKGDRVAAILPNIPETLIAFMASSSLGAIWSCCSPDFGPKVILDRFSQIHPSVLICCDGYYYQGKPFDRIEMMKAISLELGLEGRSICLSNLQKNQCVDPFLSWPEPDGFNLIDFERVPFEDPLWILYSSGTTGKPKAITHSHGGMLLEHLKYLSLHNDLKPGEHFFWYTTTGWMMWNFLQASLLLGAIPVIYDGSPNFPGWESLWQLSESLPIHHFGTSAPYLTALMKSGIKPKEIADLEELRTIGSTGAPLPKEVFPWIYENISDKVWLCSMSGGTDVCTAFVGGCIEKPVLEGRIQCRALGCDLLALNDFGETVTGIPGEMVIKNAMPCMPVYFWNDPDQERYRSSYFDVFPGLWRHGDFVTVFEDGSLTIQGRSDATLNRKGVRIGTSEIYNILLQIPALEDSLIVNVERADGSDWMPLFVKLKGNIRLNADIEGEVRRILRTQGSPRHVPDEIIQVPDIPYTLNGKKMEIPVKKLLMAKGVAKDIDVSGIKNPEVWSYFCEWVTLN